MFFSFFKLFFDFEVSKFEIFRKKVDFLTFSFFSVFGDLCEKRVFESVGTRKNWGYVQREMTRADWTRENYPGADWFGAAQKARRERDLGDFFRFSAVSQGKYWLLIGRFFPRIFATSSGIEEF